MRSTKGPLVIAAVLGVGGLLLPRFYEPDYESTTTVLTGTGDIAAERLLFYSNADVIGVVLLWVATLIVAGVIGARLARRHAKGSDS